MEVEGSAEDMAKKIVDLEAQSEWWKVEKVRLKEQVMEVKGEEARMKEKYKKAKRRYVEIRKDFDSEKKKWREENGKIREKYWEVEMMKRELIIDLEVGLSQRGDDEGAAEAQVERLKTLLEERRGEITNLLGKIEVLDRKNNSLERDLRDKLAMEAKKKKMEEEENSKLIQKIQALERDKEQMVAEVSKLQNEKREEVEKSTISAKKALEAEKKRSKEVDGKNFELEKKIVEYERAKRAMQNEVSRLNREKSEEVQKMLKEKRAYEEKVANLTKKNEALEKEKKEMEAKHSHANMEKDAEIKRILEEMALMKTEQKIALEREEYIKILYRENQNLEAKNKQLEMEKIGLAIKREECMELAHQNRLGSNVVGMLGTPAAQIRGNIKIEAQMPRSSAERIQPLSGKLTRGS